jgi:hypothetical protein
MLKCKGFSLKKKKKKKKASKDGVVWLLQEPVPPKAMADTSGLCP